MVADGSTPSCGLAVNRIRLMPRGCCLERFAGGHFEGSSDQVNWFTLSYINTQPSYGWNEYPVSGSTAWRYLRYIAGPNSYGEAAELEFYHNATKLIGVPFGSPDILADSPNYEVANAFDDDPNTFWHSQITGGDNYIGIDTQGGGCAPLTPPQILGDHVVPPVGQGQGVTLTAIGGLGSVIWSTGDTTSAITIYLPGVYSATCTAGNCCTSAPSDPFIVSMEATGCAKTVTGVRFKPRGCCLERFAGGRFQGSNDMTNWVNLSTIINQPHYGWNEYLVSTSASYRYLRYVAGHNSFGEAAELEFYHYSLKLTGDVFASAGIHANLPEYAAASAFDGNSSTFWLSDVAGNFTNNVYIGIDTQPGICTPPAAPTLIASKTTLCGIGDSLTITANGCPGMVVWSNGEKGSILTVRSVYTYSATCTSNDCCTSVASTAVTVTSGPPPAPPVVANINRCGAGVITLTATGCDGTIKWYAAAIGGTVLSIGNNYSPTVTATTTFYASCNVSDCESITRNAAIVTVKPVPVLTMKDRTRCGAGSVGLEPESRDCQGTFSLYDTPEGGTPLINPLYQFAATPDISVTTIFYDSCTVDGCESPRDTFTVFVIPRPTPPTVTVSPASSNTFGQTATVAQGESFTLRATGCATAQVFWQDEFSGGSSISTEKTYVANKTQYQMARCSGDGPYTFGCHSVPSNPVRINVGTPCILPNAPSIIATETTLSCEGIPVTFSHADGGECTDSLIWYPSIRTPIACNSFIHPSKILHSNPYGDYFAVSVYNGCMSLPSNIITLTEEACQPVQSRSSNQPLTGQRTIPIENLPTQSGSWAGAFIEVSPPSIIKKK